MQKIIFERLTVKEKERVTAGGKSSGIFTPVPAHRINCHPVDKTVGNGCLLEQIAIRVKKN
ncbi:MAG: hypothetical protein JSV88_26760 [Candidatus Aminicenantes bacterium]|nr:MAG: hypothetical protein JSV88_26760 [Candidatus Aminicenantes bacterium]